MYNRERESHIHIHHISSYFIIFHHISSPSTSTSPRQSSSSVLSLSIISIINHYCHDSAPTKLMRANTSESPIADPLPSGPFHFSATRAGSVLLRSLFNATFSAAQGGRSVDSLTEDQRVIKELNKFYWLSVHFSISESPSYNMR